MINFSKENAMVSYISKQRRTNYKDYQNCLFASFLSQIEPKKVIQALTDPSWIEAMQEEILQFKLQKVWTLVDLPKGKRAIGTKIEAIRLFLAYASFMRFIVYQMDMKSAFLYGTIEEEVIQKDDGIFISQDKYMADILKKFDFVIMKATSTLIENNKELLKDVDVHLYRSMIGSLIYLTASRRDIMFAIYACARFQVTPKVLHIYDVKKDL
ncbi:putative ribonuclease H-like domain-containing protein [Tanacetum coccineum]